MVTMPPVVQCPTKNYTPSPIRHDLIIVHRTEGSYAGSVAWLCNPAAQASAHLVMKLDGSEVTQLVPLQFKAWAQKAFNSAGVSLEIEGYTAKGMSPTTMKSAALIVAWLCAAYNIPPVWAKGGQGRGVCQHHDLGAAGGGHVDCFGVGSPEWLAFMDAVMDAYKAMPSPLPSFALHGAPGPHEIAPAPDVPHEPSHDSTPRVDPVSAVPPVLASSKAAWVQSFLNARGARLFVDGQIGPASISAIADFLAKHADKGDTHGPAA